MASLTPESVLEALRSVKYPGFSRDIVSFGIVKDIRLDGPHLEVLMVLNTSDPSAGEKIREAALPVLRALPGVTQARVKIDLQAPTRAPAGAFAPEKIPDVTHVIAVASGKGGVGKSTVAANLAVALAQFGAQTGLCDCDIYGPSIAMMFGCNERPMVDENDMILPIERCGVRLMSMGFLLDDQSPAVLRGPMVSRYTQQFLRQVAWGRLDFLVLDLPPGTGDIQLTVVQTTALSGAVVVTTPQEVALIDARKAIGMFGKTSVEVLGIVENMSGFLCPGDGKLYPIFGQGGGGREAARLGVPLLGSIPIEPEICQSGDSGVPLMLAHPDSASAREFRAIAAKVRQRLCV